jgi:hypothetical protein
LQTVTAKCTPADSGLLRIKPGLIKLVPTGLSDDPNRQDWNVHADGYSAPNGRIYGNVAAADPDVMWFWAIQVMDARRAGIVTSGLDLAKAAFRRNWESYGTWKPRQPQP